MDERVTLRPMTAEMHRVDGGAQRSDCVPCAEERRMPAISLMTMEDYEDVRDLWLHTPGMGLNTSDDSREGIARYLRRNPETCFVARCGAELAGVILAGHDGRRGYMYHTAVLPAYRGRGVGRLLVERAMDALEREGIHKAALVAFARNADGNAFWEHMGFTVRDDLVYRNREIHPLQRVET